MRQVDILRFHACQRTWQKKSVDQGNCPAYVAKRLDPAQNLPKTVAK